MRNVIYAPSFKKDQERMARRGKDLEKLVALVTLLAKEGILPGRFRPHRLRGDYGGLWECHIEGDWLLVYDCTPTYVLLHRTGSHADLFE